MSDTDPLPALFRASAEFTAAVLSTIDATHARALLEHAALSVVITAGQAPEARVVVQAPGGETALLRRVTGFEFPVELGAAAAAFLTAALARVSDEWRVAVRSGRCSLSVVVDTMPPAAHLVADEGGEEPRVLASLGVQEVQH